MMSAKTPSEVQEAYDDARWANRKYQAAIELASSQYRSSIDLASTEAFIKWDAAIIQAVTEYRMNIKYGTH